MHPHVPLSEQPHCKALHNTIINGPGLGPSPTKQCTYHTVHLHLPFVYSDTCHMVHLLLYTMHGPRVGPSPTTQCTYHTETPATRCTYSTMHGPRLGLSLTTWCSYNTVHLHAPYSDTCHMVHLPDNAQTHSPQLPHSALTQASPFTYLTVPLQYWMQFIFSSTFSLMK